MIVRLAVAVVVAACGAVAVSGSVQQNPPATTPSPKTPGELALLGNKLDEPAVKAVYNAIVSDDLQMRTVAARMAAVTAYGPFAVPIAVALGREQDAVAATEQTRAMLMTRGVEHGATRS